MGLRALPRSVWVASGALSLVALVLFGLEAVRCWHGIAAWRAAQTELQACQRDVGASEQMALDLMQAQLDRRDAQLSNQPGELQRLRADVAQLTALLEGARPSLEETSRLPMLEPLRALISRGLQTLQQPLTVLPAGGAVAARLPRLSAPASDLDQQVSAALARERTELDTELSRAQRPAHRALASAALAVALLLASAILAIATAAHAQRTAARLDAVWREAVRRWGLLESDATDYAMWVLDAAGRVSEWSQGAERLHGYTAAEVTGREWGRLYSDVDRAAGIPQQLLERAAQQGRDASEGWRMHKDGRFYAFVSVHALRDRRRRLQGFVVIERNLTEARQRRETLERTQAALMQSQKMEALGQLSSGIAHDFKNVLHVIENCVRTLQRLLSTDRAFAAPYLEMIERNAARAATLTQRLLMYARRATLQSELVDVNQRVSELADLVRHTFNEAIEIKLELADSAAMIEVDPNQFEAALLNLAVNARDAMPSGGRLTLATAAVALEGPAEARTASMRPGRYVMVAVSDTGTGMDELTQRRVLEPFFTTKGQGNALGLGLLQVRGFAEQCGGYVRIDSAPGEGTNVQLYLPRTHGASALMVPHQQSA